MGRTTGATDDQITAACKRCYELWEWTDTTDDLVDFTAHNEYMTIAETATALVPPDQRIVAVADLKALLHYAEPGLYGEDSDTLDRITALIGDES